MSLTTGSRALTLADVIDAIRVAEITDRRRQDMVCAVRRVAKLLGREPAQLPADPAALAVRLADAAPASQGLTQARWEQHPLPARGRDHPGPAGHEGALDHPPV